MCLDLNVTRTWKSFCYTENSGCKDIWLIYSVLPIPRAGKILEHNNFRLFGEPGQTPNQSQVWVWGTPGTGKVAVLSVYCRSDGGPEVLETVDPEWGCSLWVSLCFLQRRDSGPLILYTDSANSPDLGGS